MISSLIRPSGEPVSRGHAVKTRVVLNVNAANYMPNTKGVYSGIYPVLLENKSI
jgi:hypothetical protein